MKNESYNKKQCGTVKMNILIPIIGSICSLFCGIILLVSVCCNGTLFDNLVFGGLFLLGIIMIMTVNQKIEYTPLGFSYRDMFRITHNYEYSQIKKISYGKDSWITVGHRIILIDSMAVNGIKFVRIAMQYSKNAKTKTEDQAKLFNGNIKSPREFIFIWVFFIVGIVAFMLWGIYITKPFKTEDLSSYTDTVANYEFDSENDEGHKRLIIRLNSHSETFYTWEIDEKDSLFSDFEKEVSQKETFTLYFLKKDLENERTHIYLLSTKNNTYITLDRANKNNKEISTFIIGFSALFLFIWIIYIIASFYVMSNAEKYPKAIKLFVKPSYVIKKKK